METEQLIENFLEQNEITFELRAINGYGQVLMKFTDHYSADNVSGDAWKIDEYIEKLAIESQESKDEMDAEAQMQDEMDRE